MDTDDDEVTAWQHSETYPLSQYATHARLHTFRKLIIFKLTQYRNVFWIDSDTEVRANLTEYYLTLPTDRDAIISDFYTNECNDSFNSGVMVVRACRAYDARGVSRPTESERSLQRGWVRRNSSCSHRRRRGRG
jgi:alpha-N-acetylglucosamine transferase